MAEYVQPVREPTPPPPDPTWCPTCLSGYEPPKEVEYEKAIRDEATR